MRPPLQWHSQAGSITSDNRDFCAHSAQERTRLWVIADGSSSHPGSGELAQALLARLMLEFNQLPAEQLNAEQLANALLQAIASNRPALCAAYPRAACSYLLLCLHHGSAFSIHEGDCCLGLMEQGSKIRWLTNVHCAANWQANLPHAQIAQQPSRHRLTRCFSARRSSHPELNHWPLQPSQHWLLASDGFWAGLRKQEQQIFLRDGQLPAPQTDDDISCLSVITSPNR